MVRFSEFGTSFVNDLPTSILYSDRFFIGLYGTGLYTIMTIALENIPHWSILNHVKGGNAVMMSRIRFGFAAGWCHTVQNDDWCFCLRSILRCIVWRYHQAAYQPTPSKDCRNVTCIVPLCDANSDVSLDLLYVSPVRSLLSWLLIET